MKDRIAARARELGFDACRFGAAHRPDHADAFLAWLAEGRHGAMAYLERNAAKRCVPGLVLEGVRTIITLGVSYHYPTPGRVTNSGHLPTGIVARYARAADYHDVLAEPLRMLSEGIVDWGGSSTRALWYVDTGPVLERDHGMRAGLGFIGKHTNLISRSLGNWFLLGEILTNLDLEPDPPEPNRCGSCTRCLVACPTQAFSGPFQLDARKCLSYLTIEWKGPIPLEFRTALGRRIFGCDDCLEACPWNRFASLGRLMSAHHRSDLEEPELLEMLALGEAEFRARFRGTPLFRSKRKGLLRNVCVALGNISDEESVSALERAVADPEPLIAEHAHWALAEIRKRLEGLSPCPTAPSIPTVPPRGDVQDHCGPSPIVEGSRGQGSDVDGL